MLKNSGKISLDKYFTSPELAKYVVGKTKEIIGEENIVDYIEPSAGQGVFLDFLDKPYMAYDIEPEDSRIIQADYLSTNISYSKGRCAIGNPPFGIFMCLAVQFYNKLVDEVDFISFILPISQLNNNMRLYRFDLIYSENLGFRIFTDRKIHSVLNIFRRPKNGLNKKPNYKLKDVEIIHSNMGNKMLDVYDMRINAWGRGVRELFKEDRVYPKEFYIVVHRKEFRDKVLEVLRYALPRWSEIYPMTTTINLTKWQVYKYLREQIPELG